VFAEVAKAKSHGFTAADGGIQDWTTLGALKCEDLNHALATLELGQMSDGIESEQGFHIVRVLERKAAGRTSFMEAQAKIREILEAEQRASLVQAEVEKVRKTARVWTIWDGDLAGERLAQALGNKMKR
jgi:parvulin-like peptidyl-prolyl isomerase